MYYMLRAEAFCRRSKYVSILYYSSARTIYTGKHIIFGDTLYIARARASSDTAEACEYT